MGIQGELPVIEDAMSLCLELPDVTLGGYAWWVPGASSAVVLLHGWAEDASHLAAVARKVVGIGSHAVSISLRGWRGSTGVGDYGRSDPPDVARVIAWVRQREDVDRIILLGFSMGGLIALLTAASVGRGLIVDSARAAIDGIIAVNPVTHLLSMYTDTRSNTARRYFDSTLTDDQWVESSPLTHATQITCPVLVVVGLDDTMCPPDQGQRLAAAMPSIRLLEVAGMVHHPTDDQWDIILQQAGTLTGSRS